MGLFCTREYISLRVIAAKPLSFCGCRLAAGKSNADAFAFADVVESKADCFLWAQHCLLVSALSLAIFVVLGCRLQAHAVIMKLCSHYAVIVQSSCSHRAVIMQSSCSHYAVMLQSLCSHHSVIVQSSCRHCGGTMQSSCSHYAVNPPSLRSHHAVIVQSSCSHLRSSICLLVVPQAN